MSEPSSREAKWKALAKKFHEAAHGIIQAANGLVDAKTPEEAQVAFNKTFDRVNQFAVGMHQILLHAKAIRGVKENDVAKVGTEGIDEYGLSG